MIGKTRSGSTSQTMLAFDRAGFWERGEERLARSWKPVPIASEPRSDISKDRCRGGQSRFLMDATPQKKACGWQELAAVRASSSSAIARAAPSSKTAMAECDGVNAFDQRPR